MGRISRLKRTSSLSAARTAAGSRASNSRQGKRIIAVGSSVGVGGRAKLSGGRESVSYPARSDGAARELGIQPVSQRFSPLSMLASQTKTDCLDLRNAPGDTGHLGAVVVDV